MSFKVGDIVECVNYEDWPDIEQGEVCTIVGSDGSIENMGKDGLIHIMYVEDWPGDFKLVDEDVKQSKQEGGSKDDSGSLFHNHYFKDCPYDKVDVYRILEMFSVTDPCIQHATKKLLVAGGRGHKDIERDIQDVIDTLERWKQMRKEENV